ncbi:Krueppel -like 2 [Asbolus verrucosus]|uniref:Krueppel-like 2 n=1 Tax=Asbolus verrucosus TaxID=1661398 RepID=A0A482W4M6_ASBVE|nr:Krueppel -like 2 [Asbolus verrucosus]
MNDGAGPSGASQQRPRGLNVDALKQHIVAHKIDCSLWAIRILTIIFTLGYFVPIFGSAQNAYYKALIANAAINALRLHQRLGRVRLSREFLAELLIEDSCHYLFYSMIFIYTLGQNSWWGARLLISLVEFQSLNILRLIAFTEIIMMPLTVLFVLMGRASLLTPFIYYHFLTQRYTSRRNPYNRNMFYELRILIERTAEKPGLPSFIRQALLGIVNFTIKLAPIQHQQQQQHQQ